MNRPPQNLPPMPATPEPTRPGMRPLPQAPAPVRQNANAPLPSFMNPVPSLRAAREVVPPPPPGAGAPSLSQLPPDGGVVVPVEQQAPAFNRLPPGPADVSPPVPEPVLRVNPTPGAEAPTVPQAVQAPIEQQTLPGFANFSAEVPPGAEAFAPVLPAPTVTVPAVPPYEPPLRVNPTPGGDTFSIPTQAQAAEAAKGLVEAFGDVHTVAAFTMAAVAQGVASAAPSLTQPASETENVPTIAPPRLYRKSEKTTSRQYLYSPPVADHPMLGVRKVFGEAASNLPESVDLRKFCMPVRDELLSRYTGFASATFAETLWHALTDKSLSDHLAVSYICACVDHQDDASTSVANEFKVLVRQGICPESFLPFEEGEGPLTPDSACDIAAAPFRIHGPLQVDTSPNAIKAVLASDRSIVIAFAAHESFEEPGEGGSLTLPADDDPLLGGHAVLVVGYNEKGWIIRNSWGTSWGDGGYATMPYGYEKHWFEAWTATGVPQ